MRPISQRAIKLIKEFEGFSSKPYLDMAGVATIGYGETQYPDGTKVTLEDPEISEDYADHLLMLDLCERAEKIDEFLNRYKINLTDNQRGALLSFAYNLGTDRVTTSGSVHNYLKLKQLVKIPYALSLYVKARNAKTGEKEVLDGLKRRRREEIGLWLKEDDNE